MRFDALSLKNDWQCAPRVSIHAAKTEWRRLSLWRDARRRKATERQRCGGFAFRPLSMQPIFINSKPRQAIHGGVESSLSRAIAWCP